MKVSEVIEKAFRGELRWIDAADILGISDRQMRRWRHRFEARGPDGLMDARKGRVPANRVPTQTVAQVLELFRTTYAGFNVKHFWEQLVEEHGLEVSYTWTKRVLHESGYVQRYPRRKPYRRRRDRKPMRGMMLHLDGSKHRWFEDQNGGLQDLLVVLDDATGEIVASSFVPEEGARTVLALLREVIHERGTFGALYVDRASHYVYTPVAGGEADRTRTTQVARILNELGIELICAYSPQARGRSERMFRTLQGRLPVELKRAAVSTYEDANAYLRGRFLARFNRRFSVPPAESGSGFVPVVGVDLERLFTFRFERVVSNDHTFRFQSRAWQLPRVPALDLRRRTVQLYLTLEGVLHVQLGARHLASFQPSDDVVVDEAALDAA